MERAGIRAYVPLTGAGKARPYFSKDEFTYDPERDLYQCPAGEILRPKTFRAAREQIVYKAEPGTCGSCPLKPQCTENKSGRQVLRHRDERYVDRVKGYRGTFAYEKALRKRRVWVEPLFAEAKDWHGLRRFRLRGSEKVNIEALLIASGQNIKRLVAARDRGPRKLAQAAALRPADPVSRCRPHLTGRRSFGSRTGRISTGCIVSPTAFHLLRHFRSWPTRDSSDDKGQGSCSRVAKLEVFPRLDGKAPARTHINGALLLLLASAPAPHLSQSLHEIPDLSDRFVPLRYRNATCGKYTMC